MVAVMREMKDSGIVWLGHISKAVTLVPLKYILAPERNPVRVGPFGSQLSGSDFLNEESDYWVYNQRIVIDDNYAVGDTFIGKEKYDLMSGFHVRENDILITTRGTIGRISRVPIGHKPGVLHPCIIRFRIDEKKYNYNLLRLIFNESDFIARQVNYKSNATTIEVIYSETLKNIILPMWDIDMQKRIAVFLDVKCAEIDGLSADIQSEIEMLEAYKRSKVFEAIAHGINHADLQETDSDVWRTIPVKWKLMDIKYLFEIAKRIAGKEGYDILAITQQGLKVKDISLNEGQIASDYSGYQFVYPGDFAMNHMDLLTGWVDLSDKFGVTSPDYRVFRLRDADRFDRKFYKYVMQCCYMCRIFYSLGQGVSNLGRWRLQTSAFNNFKIPVPPYEEQVALGNYLDRIIGEIDGIIAQKQEQLSVLADYKKSVIYEYVTGKKEVPAI